VSFRELEEEDRNVAVQSAALPALPTVTLLAVASAGRGV
jgi:hypothetical protein